MRDRPPEWKCIYASTRFWWPAGMKKGGSFFISWIPDMAPNGSALHFFGAGPTGSLMPLSAMWNAGYLGQWFENAAIASRPHLMGTSVASACCPLRRFVPLPCCCILENVQAMWFNFKFATWSLKVRAGNSEFVSKILCYKVQMLILDHKLPKVGISGVFFPQRFFSRPPNIFKMT